MMDAKPQRPARSLRVRGDENVPPAITGPQKTIHHRNKSSPALATLAGLGNGKSGFVRTAFGDLSNTANGNRLGPAKDDLSYPVKVKAHVPEKITFVQETQEVKPAALLRPAQRPLSVTGLKNLLTSSANPKESEVTAKQSLGIHQSGPAPAPPVANIRKTLTKRNTLIFKDTLATVSEVVPELPKSVSIETAPVGQVFDERDSSTSKSNNNTNSDLLQDSSNELALTDQVTANVSRKEDFLPYTVEEPKSIGVEDQEEPQVFHDSVPVQDPTDNQHPLLTETTNLISQSYPVTVPTLSKAMPDSTHVRDSQIHLPREADEYWDDENDENIDEDGYVTATSYRSRGDNTTGGATTLLFPQVTKQVKRELAAAKQLVEATRTAEEIEDECYDTSMVAEYGDDIFTYMKELEIRMLPNAHYMDNQAEIQWSMRSVLMDWVVQVHLRFNLLPETLFLTVNYIDRFLSCKIVSLGKLQLVGATAIFIAAKYEEINCPSVQEIVYMVDGGYTVDEVLKAERFMLSMLQFELGFPGPMSFLRRISKADDYDLETRTLAKYFLEVTVMDERFVGSPASFLAAGSHCLARLMLRKGNWAPSHVYYSGYTYSQLLPLLGLMMECCEGPRKHHSSVYNKYCDKRFKRASAFVETEMLNGFRLPVSSNELGSPQIVEYFDQVQWRRNY